MKGWVLLVDSRKEAEELALSLPGGFDEAGETSRYSVVTTRAYLANPQLFSGLRPKVINLSRSYVYQSRGYYCSLLAEARGHRVIPSVETITELGDRMLYARALPELEASANRCMERSREEGDVAPVPERLLVCFGIAEDERFERFSRLLFDWFRAPILEVRFKVDDPASVKPAIKRISARATRKLTDEQAAFFQKALDANTRREWRSPKERTVARYSFATLIDPMEKTPPSSRESLRHWARIAEKMSVEIEPIMKRDLARLAEFDALFIRETTSIDNHTYRFARRAVQEGMPVIDDPVSMIRCTNKVFLQELMTASGVPVPPGVVISRREDLQRAADELGFPMVVKIPDGSFSRGVSKVENMEELQATFRACMKDSDVILAQQFIPTKFDWRVGVLGGEPLFVSQYRMARAHWQIVKHKPDGRMVEGGFTTPRLSEAPPEVVDVGLKAATLIGDGLYGVDLKETSAGVFVIEVNDNPNLDRGVEDMGERNAVWRSLTQWFIDRIEA